MGSRIIRPLNSSGSASTLTFRRSWHRLPDYAPGSFFRETSSDEWQYRLLWHGGELEYHYQLNQKAALSLTFVPGFPTS